MNVRTGRTTELEAAALRGTRLLGRIGALTVTVGVGTAIASAPGVARAQEDAGPSGTTSAERTTHSPGDREAAEGNSPPKRPTPARAQRDSPDGDDARTTGRAPRSGIDRTPEQDSAPKKRPKKPVAQRDPADVDVDADAGTAAEEVTTETVDTGTAAEEVTTETVDTGKAAEEVTTELSSSAGPEESVVSGLRADSTSGDRERAVPEPVSVTLRTTEEDTHPVVAGDPGDTIAEDVTATTSTDVAAVSQTVATVSETGTARAATVTAPTPHPVQTLLAIPGTFVAVAVNAVVNWFEPVIGPGAPLDNAVLWGILAWTRRQVNQTLANRSPEIGRQSISLAVAKNSAGTSVGELPATDIDGDTLTYTVAPGQGPANGTVTIDANVVSYTPNPGYAGVDSFDLVVTDAHAGPHIHGLGQVHTDTVRVSVTTVDDAPVITVGSEPGIGNSWYLTADGADVDANSVAVWVWSDDAHVRVAQTAPGHYTVTLDEQWAQQNPGAQVTVNAGGADPDGTTTTVTDLAIGTVNNAIAIGWSAYGTTSIPALPAGMVYTHVDATLYATVLIRSDGTVISAGRGIRQAVLPSLPDGLSYTAVTTNEHQTVVLRSDGVAIALLDSVAYPAVPALPEGVTYTDVSAGMMHTVYLRSDGVVVGVGIDWGGSDHGQWDTPEPPIGMTYTAMAAGDYHTVLIRSDGTVITLGSPAMQALLAIADAPAGLTYTAVATGDAHAVLLLSDGTAVAVGANQSGQLDIPDLPAGLTYTDVYAGQSFTVLRRSDGAVVALGANSAGQIDIPDLSNGLTYTDVGAGWYHTTLLVGAAAAVA